MLVKFRAPKTLAIFIAPLSKRMLVPIPEYIRQGEVVVIGYTLEEVQHNGKWALAFPLDYKQPRFVLAGDLDKEAQKHADVWSNLRARALYTTPDFTAQLEGLQHKLLEVLRRYTHAHLELVGTT